MTQLWRAFSGVIPLFLLVVILAFIIGVFIYRWRSKNVGKAVALKTTMLEYLLILSIIGIFQVTLIPGTLGEKSTLQLFPFISSYKVLFYSVDFSVPLRILGFNVILFIPFGVLMSLKLKRTDKPIIRTVLYGIGFSLCIEILQFLLPIGRTANIDNVILNTIGTLLGAMIGIKLLVRRR